MRRMLAVALSLCWTACSDGTGPSREELADRMLIVRQNEGDGAELFTVNPDGSGLHQISLPAGVPPGFVVGATWTPDHLRLAFAAKPPLPATTYDIFVVNTAGGQPVNVTNTPEDDELEPTWSPDGTQIAFVRGDGLWITNVDGSGERPLLGPSFNGSGYYSPEWSPDGASILYLMGNGDVWVVNATGPAVPERIGPSSPAIILGKPTWKPDGSRILLAGHLIGGEPGFITFTPDGTDEQVILPPAPGTGAVWSPDGTRIAYRDDQLGHLWILTPATSEAVDLGISISGVVWK